MRNGILFISLLITVGLHAQSTDWFAPVGATWTYYAHTDYPPYFYGQRPYFQAKIVKDSMILGKECRKLVAVDPDSSLLDNSTVWLYIDSTRIYFLRKDTFQLFFDRSLKAGDTLILSVPANNEGYNFTCCPYNEIKNWSAHIDSITTVNLDGENLTRWFFTYLDSFHTPYLGQGPVQFTEKIGFVPFFGFGQICCVAGFDGEFHCYQDQTTFINMDTVDCTYPLGIKPVSRESVQVVPNPTDRNIQITLPASLNPASSLVRIYSLDGRLISASSLSGSRTLISLDVPAGLYLLQVQAGDRQFIKHLSVLH